MPTKLTQIFLMLILLPNIEIGCQESPCPRLFLYDPIGREKDKWFGIVTLLSDSDLNGVSVTLIFDRPLLHLENWFGEVVIRNNREYVITNENHNLTANTLYPLRFYVKFDPNQPSPRLVSFQFNAKTVCPEEQNTAVAPPQLFTNKQLDWTQHQSSSDTPGSEAVDDIECGTVAAQPIPLIAHGQGTQAGEYPWHAALYLSKGVGLTYICGGSLLSRYHVITVAHCVSRSKSQSLLNPENLLIYLGKYYLKRWGNPGVQSYEVARIIRHEAYDSTNAFNNIAILKLAKPAQFTDFVRPICLWEGSNDVNDIVGKLGAVVGWGYDENGKLTEELTKTNIPIVRNEVCIRSYPDFFAKYTTSETFCAGFRNGTSVCNGDSGGGMVFPKDTGNPNKKAYQLRGLVSVSVALRNQFMCDTTHYVIFLDVAKYLEFIRDAMKQ